MCSRMIVNSSPPSRQTQSDSDLLQQGIAEVMTERIVHDLEVVEIEEQQRDDLIGRSRRQYRGQATTEVVSIRQSRQRVEVGEHRESSLGPLALMELPTQ